MRVIVFANAAAGLLGTLRRDDVGARLRRAFRDAGVDADVRVLRGRRLAESLAAIRPGDADAVVAAGGDGTVNAVASALAGTCIPLGILPVGTLNHFARDVGTPIDLRAAVEAIASGAVSAVDVGEVNGRVFVNNSSIGLYPRMVRGRDSQRMRLGRGKWRAMFWATVAVFRRFPVLEVRLTFDDRCITRTTPFVFVGNNEYNMDLFSLGSRARLDSGVLSVYVANRTGRFGMLRLAVRALVGRLNQTHDFDTLTATEFSIETRKRRLRVAVDGELLSLRPPLRYRSRPRALRVIVPPGEGQP